MKKAILLLASFSLALVVAELGLRMLWFGSLSMPPFETIHGLRTLHPTRGWALAADRQAYERRRAYAAHWSTNSKGLRDVERSYVPRDDAFRVVLLGDSFVEGRQVGLEETLHMQLQSELEDHRVEVVNLGVSGYGTTQQLLYLREEGLKYEPDVVLLAFFPENDFRDDSSELAARLTNRRARRTEIRPFALPLPEGGYEIREPDLGKARERLAHMTRTRARWKEGGPLRETALHELFVLATNRLGEEVSEGPRFDLNIWLGPYVAEFEPDCGFGELQTEDYRSLWEDAWRRAAWLLTEMNAAVEAAGARLVVLTIPSDIQVDPALRAQVTAECPQLELDVALADRRLESLATEQGIAFLPLLPAFQQASRAGGRPLFHSGDDRHWSAEGHRVAAQAVADFLRTAILAPR